ncbi:hypothetical protein C7G98_13425 [Acinetobacter baumannii]|uniref:hypothetical protein n=1 Tax=Acinetobacter baumannii TaxID=470 RepID=UPI000D0B602F|nr:hypothetical protein [Acinetobacter baumannii]MDH2582839.1 hypothetical protein [Acinetobacter baumannii]PSE09461.1 hypothetical protein C7G98_13425 [Acinetobacter baumannii]
MFSLNVCKLSTEYGTVEIVDEFYFKRIFIENDAIKVNDFLNLQQVIEFFNLFSDIFLKDKFSYYFISILSRYKIVTDLEELNLINRLNLSNNFKFDSNELLIFFEADSIEDNYAEFNAFKKKEELLSNLKNEIVGKKRWFNLTKFEKKCWLDLAFSNRISTSRHLNLTMDGNYILCEEDLYCYLGEEIYGIFGYIAYNSNALADAISTLSLKIKWINFDYSIKHFDKIEDLEYLIDILKQYSSLETV